MAKSNFKKGDRVREIMRAPIEGVVIGFSHDDNTGDVIPLVQWAEQRNEGTKDEPNMVEHIHSKYFDESYLELVKEEEES